MKWHKVILDISMRLVHLNSPMYEKVTVHLLAITCIKASLHHLVERKIEEIHCDVPHLKQAWSVLIKIITGCHYRSNDA
jgi:hypothetical protein